MKDDVENSDEIPILSNTTLEALKEFYADRDARKKLFEDLKSASEDDAGQLPLTMDAFAEDWNESQFWYSQETATVLAKQLLVNSNGETTIAVISAPSVFVQLKNLLATSNGIKPIIFLLEFDDRFTVFPEFVHYDFHNPFNLPCKHNPCYHGRTSTDAKAVGMKGAIDHIICDPPFLSEDCQTKAALTVRWLSRRWDSNKVSLNSIAKSGDIIIRSRLIVCTGERMEALVSKLYRPQGVETTTFLPVHARGLSNEFYCYANFECDDWKFKS